MSTTEKVMVTAPAGVSTPETLVATAPGVPDLKLVPLTKHIAFLLVKPTFPR